jgi:hypothetical protein
MGQPFLRGGQERDGRIVFGAPTENRAPALKLC